MKILHVHDNPSYVGGAETYIFGVQEFLKKNGHDVYFFSFGDAQSGQKDKVYIYSEPKNKIAKYVFSYFSFKLYRSFRKCLVEIEPDIVHLHHNYKSPAAIVLAAKKEGAPVIQTLHDYNILCPIVWCTKPGGEICEGILGLRCARNRCISYKRYCIVFLQDKIRRYLVKNKVDLVISPSRALKEKLNANGIKNVVHLPYFIDTSDYEVDFKSMEEGNIFYAGNLLKNKGINHLIEAFPKILKQKPQARLHIVGDGDYRKNLEELAMKFGVEKETTFHGRVPHERIRDFYRRANVVVFPPTGMEQFGMVGLESMVLGRPVVGSRIGGIPDWLEDGRTGFLVEPGNPDQIAEKVIRILTDVKLAESMGRHGREKAEREFDVKKHIEELVKIYKMVLDGKSQVLYKC